MIRQMHTPLIVTLIPGGPVSLNPRMITWVVINCSMSEDLVSQEFLLEGRLIYINLSHVGFISVALKDTAAQVYVFSVLSILV